MSSVRGIIIFNNNRSFGCFWLKLKDPLDGILDLILVYRFLQENPMPPSAEVQDSFHDPI